MIGLSIEDIKFIINRLWRSRIIILLITLAGTLAGLAIAESVSNTYVFKATSSICVTYSVYPEQLTGGTVLTNYSEVVASNRVCEYAAISLEDIGVTPDQIQNSISVTLNNNSYVMQITAKSSKSANAMRIANAVAYAFVEQITMITGNSSINVLDTAKTVTPIPGNEQRNIMLAGTLGSFLLSAGFIIFKEMFSSKVNSIYQCYENKGEILTAIPYCKKG